MSTELLWDREGHLHELGVHRLLSGELSGEALAAVEAHLAGCTVCVARRDAVQAVAEEPLPPLKFLASTNVTADQPAEQAAEQAADRPGRRLSDAPRRAESARAEAAPAAPAPRAARPARRWWAGAAGVAALVLAGVMWRQAGEGGEEFTARGGELRLEVWREEQGGVRRLQSGDEVRAGDRLGFRVASAAAGELIVAGVDGAGAVYPVWPSAGAGSAPAGSAPVVAGREAQQLDAAIHLDATPGAERIVALRCGERIGWDWLSGALKASGGVDRLPELRAGCAQEEIRLPKR